MLKIKNILLKFLFIILLSLCFSNKSFALLDIENNGNWFFYENSDPFNDEKEIYLCKNSNDRQKISLGSYFELCFVYNKSKNTIGSYLKSAYMYTSDCNKLYKSLIRFGNKNPENIIVKGSIDKNDDKQIFLLNNPLTIIDELKHVDKLAIKVFNFFSSGEQNLVAIFDNDPEYFTKMINKF